ncbi:hypothetical protein CLOM_g4107 [Closterium sp. NIES-68]|nr:hypothetical protein CLOM_g4107 [Closterium sp. NIES-68]GJP62931.1 hypothetical protein CLOP_g19994 [Closterium sp. NIES-67]
MVLFLGESPPSLSLALASSSLLLLLLSTSTCHALIHPGAVNAGRPRVAVAGVTEAAVADAGISGGLRGRLLCDDNSTDAAGGKKHGPNGSPLSNGSRFDGVGSNRASDDDSETQRGRTGNGRHGSRENQGGRQGSRQSEDREERNENREGEESSEKIVRERSERSEKSGKSENSENSEKREKSEKSEKSKGGNTLKESDRGRKDSLEDGKGGKTEKGERGNGSEGRPKGSSDNLRRSATSSDNRGSSEEVGDHKECNDSSGNTFVKSPSSTSGGGRGIGESLAGQLGGWGGVAGGNKGLPSWLAALLADAAVRLTVAGRTRSDGQGLDLGRRAGQQGSSPDPTRSGHSPDPSGDQVLANPLMALNLFVFNAPIEISAVRSLENKGSVALHTQLALTTALARDNGTVTQGNPQRQESGLGVSEASQNSTAGDNGTVTQGSPQSQESTLGTGGSQEQKAADSAGSSQNTSESGGGEKRAAASADRKRSGESTLTPEAGAELTSSTVEEREIQRTEEERAVSSRGGSGLLSPAAPHAALIAEAQAGATNSAAP